MGAVCVISSDWSSEAPPSLITGTPCVASKESSSPSLTSRFAYWSHLQEKVGSKREVSKAVDMIC